LASVKRYDFKEFRKLFVTCVRSLISLAINEAIR
jgi:hypothetical protein